MRIPLAPLLVSICASVASPYPSSAGETGRVLLTGIMDKPGSWSQMCSSSPPLAFDAPVPVFSGRLVGRHFNLGPAEAQRLKASRAEVVPALVDILKAMDFTRPPKVTRGKESGPFDAMRSGLRPDWLNSLHLQIIGELSAVETLPELLRLEEQLHGLLEAAQKNAKAPLPPLDLDAPGFFEKPGDNEKERPDNWWESAEHKRDEKIFTCRVLQRELLGTVTLLLLREEHAPVNGAFEAPRRTAYEKQLAEARQNIADAKTELVKAESAGAEEVTSAREVLKWREADLKTLEADKDRFSFSTDYTPALREEIRTMAQTFLNTVPPGKRRGAAAMPEPAETK